MNKYDPIARIVIRTILTLLALGMMGAAVCYMMNTFSDVAINTIKY